MVEVKLVDVFAEHRKMDLLARSFGARGTRWYAAVALTLRDESAGRAVSEWFYLIACSKEYHDRPFKRGPALQKQYTIVQEEFDLEQIREIARKKLSKIRAANWDDFYEQMRRDFLWED